MSNFTDNLKTRWEVIFLIGAYFVIAVISESFIFATFVTIGLATFFIFKSEWGKNYLMPMIFNSLNINKGQQIEIIKNKFNMDNLNINENIKNMSKKVVWGVVIFIVAIIILVRLIVIIQAGETGVYHLFGKVKDAELKSGIHIINPLASVTKMSIRTEKYTMSVVGEEDDDSSDDSIDALTNEGLTIKLDITVLYHLIEDRASDIYKNLGEDYEEKIIRPEIRSVIREVVARYDSKSIYSEKRDEIVDSIKRGLENNLSGRGIVVEGTLLRNVSLPPKLSDSIQQKLQAEQENQRYDFLVEKEKKEAQRKIIEAEGQRDAQKIINESLSDKYLNYLYIKELKDRQGTIYVPINPETGMPIFKGVQ